MQWSTAHLALWTAAVPKARSEFRRVASFEQLEFCASYRNRRCRPNLDHCLVTREIGKVPPSTPFSP